MAMKPIWIKGTGSGKKPPQFGLGVLRDDFGGTTSSVKRSGGGGSANNTASLQSYINSMYRQFKPTPITYEKMSAEALRESISAWLRPSYEQAIFNRQKRTETSKAELDADAISRGMGASTYVTDVKNRQQNEEARDIALMESEYGATLSKHVAERTEAEEARALEVEMFNREQEQKAYQLAYSAAVVLFNARSRGGGGGGSKAGGVVATTPENCEWLLQSMDKNERAQVYAGTDDLHAQYRAEIVASVGTGGYIKLMGKYPSIP